MPPITRSVPGTVIAKFTVAVMSVVVAAANKGPVSVGADGGDCSQPKAITPASTAAVASIRRFIVPSCVWSPEPEIMERGTDSGNPLTSLPQRLPNLVPPRTRPHAVPHLRRAAGQRAGRRLLVGRGDLQRPHPRRDAPQHPPRRPFAHLAARAHHVVLGADLHPARRADVDDDLAAGD